MMSIYVNFPLFCIVACLICSAVSSLLSGKAARKLTLFLTAAVTLLYTVLFFCVKGSGIPVIYTMGHFSHPWGNELRFGILECLISAIFSSVLFLAILGGRSQLERDLHQDKSNLYYVMTDLLQSALLVLVSTNDIFTGYVFIEICTISSCGLLMIREVGRTTLASVRYMIFSLVGSGLFLFGVIILYNITGHLLFPDLKQAVAALWSTGSYHIPLITAMAFITVGISIKSGLFPFHFWMPDTYSFSTPTSSGILSGLVSKGYIFFLLKIIFDGFGTDVFYQSGLQNIVFLFGAAGIVIGSLSAIRENDICKMLAYSSAAQIGYIYMGIGLSPAFGAVVAVFHIITHAVTKPGLFLSAAQLSDASGGSHRFCDLQGSGYRSHFAAAAFTLGAFSMIGLPLTMGFISKYLFAMTAFDTGLKKAPTLIVLAVSTILNTLYFARTVIRIYNKPEHEMPAPLPVRYGGSYRVSAALFCIFNLASGIAATPLITLLEQGIMML